MRSMHGEHGTLRRGFGIHYLPILAAVLHLILSVHVGSTRTGIVANRGRRGIDAFRAPGNSGACLWFVFATKTVCLPKTRFESRKRNHRSSRYQKRLFGL